MYESRPGEAGWLTTKATKPRMVDDLGEMSRNGDIQIRSLETVSEMRTFVEKNGSYNAETGYKDDRVDTAGMASQMMTLLPKRFQELRNESDSFKGFANFRHREGRKESGEYREVLVA